MRNSFVNGKPWLDTEGKPIQAHGFSVFHKDGLGTGMARTKSIPMAKMVFGIGVFGSTRPKTFTIGKIRD